jgi:hypothetical protein
MATVYRSFMYFHRAGWGLGVKAGVPFYFSFYCGYFLYIKMSRRAPATHRHNAAAHISAFYLVSLALVKCVSPGATKTRKRP